ncbi:hypothetical protein POREN0001_0647 [Porphyromonas endodontalis ATCC 35406]|uniref:Uncharacterized protein n=1 Tax=Porphyromonas endodontalis (strain ATCC 35406 / DSM 24491 / JCM 8526 / CCUG 16442 / BCRC 14492 / NCTC 13058 / HG 370) TaxID=553175 RepID=C3J8X6_POREA|nr:hypothetical protein POREN0001_0647 [Porphyromonas endodontalis ATCC 35406]
MGSLLFPIIEISPSLGSCGDYPMVLNALSPFPLQKYKIWIIYCTP